MRLKRYWIGLLALALVIAFAGLSFGTQVAAGVEKFVALTLSGATASTVPYFDAQKALVSSSVTPTELGYVSGVTSAIQTQLDTKASKTFSLASGANAACATTCGTKTCIAGQEATSKDLLACNDATADVCICEGT